MRQLRCHPRHFTAVQIYEVRPQKFTTERQDACIVFQLFFNAHAWSFDYLTPILPVLTVDIVNRIFIEFSASEEWVAIHSGVAAERADIVSSQANDQSFTLLPKAVGILDHGSIFVNVCGNNVRCAHLRVKVTSVERARLPAWLYGYFSYCRESQYDLGLTVRPQFSHMR
ncbi:hypothetical protein TNCV_3901291 [Trichonephila clavipes]|nr:hypothetical protein TNCV_3901291 [Trichonephila clavipes]